MMNNTNNYVVTVWYATGFGVATKDFKESTYANLMKRVENVKANALKHTIHLEKMVFNYPSGKKFVDYLKDFKESMR